MGFSRFYGADYPGRGRNESSRAPLPSARGFSRFELAARRLRAAGAQGQQGKNGAIAAIFYLVLWSVQPRFRIMNVNFSDVPMDSALYRQERLQIKQQRVSTARSPIQDCETFSHGTPACGAGTACTYASFSLSCIRCAPPNQ